VALPLRRWPCWPGPYSRLLKGLLGRPQMFSPIRRSILYFASARFVIAIPLIQVQRGTRPPLRLKQRRQASKPSKVLRPRVTSNDKRAPVKPESAPDGLLLEERAAAVKPGGHAADLHLPGAGQNDCGPDMR